jgi:outer membrane protein OmpA-like peptidoglycan-associated protein
MKNVVILFCCFISLILSAQKAEKLRVGEKIPFSRVVVFNQDNKTINLDLPNGKTTTDRFVLVYFYSADKPAKELISYNNEIERILNKYQNNACKGASEIEYATVCIEKDFTKWQTLLTETNYNKAKFTGKKTNYLAKDGMKDKAVTVFKLTKAPSLFLVNPKGRLYLETDSFQVLEKTFQNICRVNAAYSTAEISGKILTGDKTKAPISDLDVFLVKNSLDTINKTKTDNYGDFYFKQIDTTQNLSIRISQNEKIKNTPKIYLAKQTGAIIAEFKRNANGFEYKLLETDMVKLSQLDEEEGDITFKFKQFDNSKAKNISINENIYYEVGKYDVTLESEIVLDKVITILNTTPSVKLEVVSHTDAQGDDASNLRLSENRSTAVIFYLVNKGIDKNRLKGIGKGESEIRNRCANGVPCSDKEQEYNRRTEFKFIKN